MHVTANTDLRLPEGFRKNLLNLDSRGEVHKLLRNAQLNTVCEEAKCPNIGECFSNKTATFMILGDRCTRRCKFCSVTTAKPFLPSKDEPNKLAQTARALGLDHVVITSVDRDDLPDLGAKHFSECITELKKTIPGVTVELLTPDFKGKPEIIDQVLASEPHIFGHNIETVERLYKKVRPQSHWEITCAVLKYVANFEQLTVKSGIMVGLGENDDEVSETLIKLANLGVHVVTIGQYLRPSIKHWPVDRYVSNSSYTRWIKEGRALGFKNIFAGPFVRSSYHAKETYQKANT
ncbi:MAG: lipoyl synthase [bacterium]|nr:lipoyl synthase [bacterium]